MQLTAPDAFNVFVTDPGAQTKHAPWPALPWYVPAVHIAHAVKDDALNWPAEHTLQVVALALNVLVMLPLGHTTHSAVATGLY